MSEPENSGFLRWVERAGNTLPDPVFIFVWLIGVLMLVSMVCAGFGVVAVHPVATGADGAPLLIEAQSLLSPENIRRLLVEMPQTFTHFHPLGYVLVVMLGAGVAERSGLFAAAMKASVRNAPAKVLTPIVALAAMLGNHAADAAYVVLIPLAGVLYAAAGRHPIAGIATGFAGVSGGFSANVLPGQLDALLFGITEQAAESLLPSFDANIAGNWYFIIAMVLIYVPIVWFVTDRVIEPRLGPWSGGVTPGDSAAAELDIPSGQDSKALRAAGLAALIIVICWAILVLAPNAPLVDTNAAPEARLTPFFRSLVAGFMLLFLASAWAYGAVAGTVNSHRDITRMMSESMSNMAYYLVLAFAAAHFVAMFNWSGLGLILAINGTAALQSINMPAPLLLALIALCSGLANIFIGSASAKWALLAPVLIPMLMLLGTSPEMTTAAYRIGDSATNIITPLMPYFPLVLIFAKRWDNEFGIGSLAAIMIPYSLWMMISGTVLTIIWVALGIPLGPGVGTSFTFP